MYLVSFLPLAVLPFAFAVNHNVTVGADKSNKPGLYFTPDTLNPKVDDKIVFTFVGDKHSVAQSTFDKPCEYVENGIFSSFPGPSKTFTITINNTDPIWLYCSQEQHCRGGQVLALNPPKDKTLAQYKAAAEKTDGVEDEDNQPSVKGGVIDDVKAKADSSSTASSSSSAATSTSGSTTSPGGATGTTTSSSPAATTGAAGRLTVGTGLGAMGLLGLLAGGMI